MAALFGYSMFHNLSTVDDDGIPDECGCTEFGDDRPEEVSKELEAKINEAEKEGFPVKKVNGLKAIIQKHRLVLRIHLGAEGLADMVPMKFRLDSAKKTVRVEERKYPAKQRNFLNAYISQRVKLGYLHPKSDASCRAAPRLVAKEPTQYRVTIDLRTVTAVTLNEVWPIPTIVAERAGFVGCSRSATILFVLERKV